MLAIIKRLKKILNKREKRQVSLLFFAILVMTFIKTLGVASVLPFLALVMEPNIVFENRYLLMVYEYFNFTSISRFIIFSGAVMFVIIIISNVVTAFVNWFQVRFVYMNNHRLAQRLLEKYLSLPYSYFLNQNSADLSKNVLGEVGVLTKSYLMPIINIFTKILTTAFMLTLLFMVDVVASIIAIFILGGAYGVIYLKINNKLKLYGHLRMLANKMRYKAVSEAFGGIKEIKIMNREPYYLDKFSKESFEQAKYQSWLAVVEMIPKFALEAIAFGGIIVFVLILLLTREDARQVVPIAGLFAYAGTRLMPAIQGFFTNFSKMKFNKSVLDRIYSDFTKEEEGTIIGTFDKQKKLETLPFKNEIKLENVSYKYPNTTCQVVKNIYISIKKNTAVAFVGPTGVGKTTLVDIILGLLQPQVGRLLVDGTPLDQTNTIKWQRNIGYVPQHIYLSDNSVARNIAFGMPGKKIDYEILEKVARIANIHEFINGLPDGYETLVGERGIRLSGGQRQRIGIARALYHDPEVLVFDEATSALDGITEEAVLKAMDNAAEMKTLIIIAHRLTTVKNCDVVYVLEEGEIVAQGTYDDLIINNAQFKNMARIGASN